MPSESYGNLVFITKKIFYFSEKKIMIFPMEKITDIHQLIKVVVDSNKKFGGQIWWRGHSKTTYKLIPSVFRPRKDNGGFEYEKNINVRFKQKAPALMHHPPKKRAWFNWLFLMQHYGLPTRLLDWTESPLIACYFAVNDPSEIGAVFALCPYKLNYEQNKKYALSLPSDENALSIAQGAFEQVNPKDKVLAILPDLINKRMISQLSVFTIHATGEPLEEMNNSSDFLIKYEIPGNAKELLKEQLKHVGIRQSSLFPDLEHLSNEIKDIKSFKHS